LKPQVADARKAILSLSILIARKTSDYEKRNAAHYFVRSQLGCFGGCGIGRDLNKDGVPVLLTVQVDSVAKTGQNDALIPEKRGGSG